MLPVTYAVAVQCQDQQFQGLQVEGGIGMLSTMTCAYGSVMYGDVTFIQDLKGSPNYL